MTLRTSTSRLAVAAVIAAGGCGGGGGETLTHAELVKEVDRICADLARENRSLELPFRPYSSQSEEFFASFEENVDEAEGKLDDLDPPREDTDALNRLVDGYESIRVRLEAAQVAAATDQDQEVTPLFSEIEDQAVDVEAAEDELGVCPGRTSVRHAVVAAVQRTRPNPLGESGELGG